MVWLAPHWPFQYKEIRRPQRFEPRTVHQEVQVCFLLLTSCNTTNGQGHRLRSPVGPAGQKETT